MWTKNSVLWLKIHVDRFRLSFPIALFVLESLIWDFVELFDFIGWKRIKNKKHSINRSHFMLILTFLHSIYTSYHTSYDLVDIDVSSPKEKVKVKIKVL